MSPSITPHNHIFTNAYAVHYIQHFDIYTYTNCISESRDAHSHTNLNPRFRELKKKAYTLRYDKNEWAIIFGRNKMREEKK